MNCSVKIIAIMFVCISVFVYFAFAEELHFQTLNPFTGSPDGVRTEKDLASIIPSYAIADIEDDGVSVGDSDITTLNFVGATITEAPDKQVNVDVSEVDTLQTVTDRGATTTNDIYAPAFNISTKRIEVSTFTAAGINAAIDELGIWGGEVYLPEGTYVCTDATITIDHGSTTLTGAGKYTTKLDWQAGQAATGIDTNGQQFVTIRNLALIGDTAGGATTALIGDGDNANYLTVQNCFINVSDDKGINTSGTRVRVLDCDFLSCDGNSVDIADDYALVRGNTFNNSGGYSVYLFGADHGIIAENHITGGDNHGIYVNAYDYVTVSDNVIRSTASGFADIKIFNDANQPSVTGNICYGVGVADKGIWFDNVDDGVISNNVLENFDVAAIQIDADCNRISCGGNIVHNGVGYVNNGVDGLWRATDDAQVDGELYIGDFDSGDEGIAHLLNDTVNCGVLHAIEITDETGRNISWTAGVIWDCVGLETIETDLNGSTACTDNQINYLYWDRSGGGTALTLSTTVPNYTDNDVLVGIIAVQTNDIYEIHEANLLAKRETDADTAIREILQVIVTSGLVVTENVGGVAFDVAISAGTFYHFGTTRHNLAAGFNTTDDTAMTRWFHNDGTDWTNDSNAQIDMTNWDDPAKIGGWGLDTRNNAKYYKSMFMYSENMIHWIYPQVEYDTLAQAVAADPPVIPSVGEFFPRMVSVVMKGNDAAFPAAGGSRWDYSIKPTLGSPGIQAQDHASQINLAWTNSGHSGTAFTIAGFDGAGAAAEYSTNWILNTMIAADEVYDTDINWGTGANQVSLDDVPDGTSYERVAAAELSSGIYKNATTAVKGIASFFSEHFTVAAGVVKLWFVDQLDTSGYIYCLLTGATKLYVSPYGDGFYYGTGTPVFGDDAENVIALGGGVAPTTNILNTAQLWSDVGSTPDSQTKLLLHFNDLPDGTTSTTDESASNHPVTFNNNAETDTDVTPKFGAASLKLATPDDSVSMADDSDWDFGAADFTIDFWLNQASAEHTKEYVIYKTAGTGLYFWSFTDADQYYYIRCYFNGSSYDVKSGEAFPGAGWHHIAYCRDGVTLRLYVDGVQKDTATIASASDTFDDPVSPFYIGNKTAGRAPTGNIDEFRVSSGICRYPDGTSFTPETEGYGTTSAELTVMDGDGTITTLSPHNFGLIPAEKIDSYSNPWSYNSYNNNIGKHINVDMYGALKAIESLSGQKFIYERDIPIKQLEAAEEERLDLWVRVKRQKELEFRAAQKAEEDAYAEWLALQPKELDAPDTGIIP